MQFIDVPILQYFNGVSYKYPLEREPHVSLLINQGFDALIIAERVGHENVSTTLNTYAHLFPSRQSALVSSLEELGRSGECEVRKRVAM